MNEITLNMEAQFKQDFIFLPAHETFSAFR